MLDATELISKKLSELRKLAKNLKIKYADTLRKEELIHRIIEAELKADKTTDKPENNYLETIPELDVKEAASQQKSEEITTIQINQEASVVKTKRKRKAEKN